VGAYERLLLDVIDGRLNLFVRSDEQEEAWRWVEPLLHHWQGHGRGLQPYAAGSWGPISDDPLARSIEPPHTRRV
jgi:glucose-6-phosphate 1-dehydrogenase